MASLGKRVVMVDGDGQQNLMQLALRYAVENPPHGAGWTAGDYEGYLQSNLGLNCHVKSLEEATRAFRSNPQAGELLIPYRYLVPNSPGNRLSVILAGNNFEKLEQKLSEYLPTQVAINNHDAAGMLFHAIWRSSSQLPRSSLRMPGYTSPAEVILIDLAPSLGAVNMNLLMHCDYFLTPCAPDQFSQKALERLMVSFRREYRQYVGTVMQGMVTGLRSISRGFVNSESQPLFAKFPLPSMQPRFAGCMISNYSASPINTLTMTGVKRSRDEQNNQVEHLHIEEPEGKAAKRLSSLIMTRADQLAEVLMHDAVVNEEGHVVPQVSERSASAGIFAVPADDFPHAKGDNLYPQPHTAARLRKAVAGFEHSATNVGYPAAFLTEDLLERVPGLNNTPVYREHVAHFQRIYLDLAEWLIRLQLNTSQEAFDFNLPEQKDNAWMCTIDSSGTFP